MENIGFALAYLEREFFWYLVCIGVGMAIWLIHRILKHCFNINIDIQGIMSGLSGFF